jgi:hypothetical protein
MLALSDDDIRNYHVGMSYESAWRAYAGMIETGETNLEKIEPLIPANIAAELRNYFTEKINNASI